MVYRRPMNSPVPRWPTLANEARLKQSGLCESKNRYCHFGSSGSVSNNGSNTKTNGRSFLQLFVFAGFGPRNKCYSVWRVVRLIWMNSNMDIFHGLISRFLFMFSGSKSWPVKQRFLELIWVPILDPGNYSDGNPAVVIFFLGNVWWLVEVFTLSAFFYSEVYPEV